MGQQQAGSVDAGTKHTFVAACCDFHSSVRVAFSRAATKLAVLIGQTTGGLGAASQWSWPWFP